MTQPASGTSTFESARQTGTWAAGATALLAAVSFGTAVTTPPRSGPFATQALAYPYDAAAAFVSRDFLWMGPAILMMLAFVVLAACIRERATPERRVAGAVAFALASAAFTIIALDYFIQLRTVQPSLVNGEAGGLAILSQYNPHGVFIALEELGFLASGVSFLFLALALGPSRLERAARWVLLGASTLVAAAFAVLSLAFGLQIEYRFEVAAISVVWLTLVAAGTLLGFAFAAAGPRREPERGTPGRRAEPAA